MENELLLQNILKYQVCEKQNTDTWNSERLKRITASDVYDVIDKNKRIKSYEKVFKIKTGQLLPFNGNLATEWGKQQEYIAINYYREITGNNVKLFGLIQHKIYNFLGGSPDGIVIDDKNNVILLEIKCTQEKKK